MAKITLDAELVGAQYDFFEDDDSKFLHLSGGYGAGKTLSLNYKIIKLSILNRPHDGGILCPSFTDMKRDVLPSMIDILDKHSIPYDWHGTDHTLKLPWSTGCIRFLTAEKKLRGGNLAYIGVNELGLIQLERYLEAIARVRIKDAKNPQIVSSGTPDMGIASPYYEIFVDKPWKGSRILYMDTRDNAHNLNEGYIEALYNSYPKVLLDAYLSGAFVNLSGNRFYYCFDPSKHCVAHNPDPQLPFHIGIDFNVSPMTASIWQEHGEKLVALDEIYLDNLDGYKTENLVEAMKSRGYLPNNCFLYPDPSGNSRSTKGFPDNEIMRRAGYQVRTKATAPRFRERQINMNARFEKGLLEIHPTKCPMLKRDFLAVESDPVTLEKKKNNPKLTHMSDGADYMVDILRPFKEHKTQNYISKIR